MEGEAVMLRIGEVSRRLGVSAHVLRAWERRYGVLHPVRSENGYRLYSELDERRIRAMQTYLARGLSTSEAALAALAEIPAPTTEPSPLPEPPRHAPEEHGDHEDLPRSLDKLARSLDRFDEPAAETLLDHLLSGFTVETVLRKVVLPLLYELGERWSSGEISVAQEHFAANVVRGRLAGLCRGWGRGTGPRALLACAPGELHDIPLLAFGVVLYRNGWRVGFLGSGLPLSDVIRTATDSPPRVTVLSAVTPKRFDGLAAEMRRLARVAPLAIGGRGATREIARAGHARLLSGDLVTEAERLERSLPAQAPA